MRLGLGQRVVFTLGALLVYGIGTYAPVPGVDPAMWEQLFHEQGPLWQTHFWMN
jgi:preprotein translocase subunit SecY